LHIDAPFKENENKKSILELLKALEIFKNVRIIFTFPGFDLGADIIIKEIKKFVKNTRRQDYFFNKINSFKFRFW
jgi:hypothetical protein